MEHELVKVNPANIVRVRATVVIKLLRTGWLSKKRDYVFGDSDYCWNSRG